MNWRNKMIVHLPKLAFALATVTISQLGFIVPVLAEEEMTATELYRLCTAFPLNSRCEGYTPPVALKQRPGNEGICKVQAGETKNAGRCKILLTDELITIFVEEGDKLALLDDQRDTQEISVAVGDVSNLRYRETSKRDVEETIGLTLLVGLLPALLFSRPDHFSEITVGLTNTNPSNPTALTLITDRDLGMNLRTSLERSTGLFADVLLDEEDEPEEASPTVIENRDPEPTDLDSFCQEFPLNSRCQASEPESDGAR
jgi:hypothetical protein